MRRPTLKFTALLILSLAPLMLQAAHASVMHAAYEFTVTSDTLDAAARERLAGRILRAVSRTDGPGESAVALYSPSTVVHWSPADLSYQRNLEEVAERCLGFDMVVKGHIAHLNGRAEVTLQCGLMRGRQLLVLPAVVGEVAVNSTDEIPDLVAHVFMRTWPAILEPSGSAGHWGAGREAGVREGDLVWPLDALPSDRAALGPAVESVTPVAVAQSSNTLCQLAEEADPTVTYVRLTWPPERETFAWRAAVIDDEGDLIDFGTLTLSDDTGWTTTVDLAATDGRCVADIPLGVPMVGQLTTPRGTSFFESLLLDSLAEDKGTWQWSSTIRDLVVDLTFAGDGGEDIGILAGDTVVPPGELAPPISRRVSTLELTSAPDGIIVPFTYSVDLSGIEDGTRVVLPLMVDYLHEIQNLLEQGDLDGALTIFEEDLAPTRESAHPQYGDALAAIHAHMREEQIADPATLSRVWALEYDTFAGELKYPQGVFVRPIDTLGVLLNATELARALALTGHEQIDVNVVNAIRADMVAIGRPALATEEVDIGVRRKIVSAHIDLYDTAQALAGEELNPEQWELLEMLAADLEEITLSTPSGALADQRLGRARETHRRLGARIAQRRANESRDELTALREIHSAQDLGLPGVERLFDEAEAAISDPTNPTPVDFDALERQVQQIIRVAVDDGFDRLARVEQQREVLRSAGYLYDVTETIDTAESEALRAIQSGDTAGAWQVLRPAVDLVDSLGIEEWNPAAIEEISEADHVLTATLERVRDENMPGRSEAIVAAQGWRRQSQEFLRAGDLVRARQTLTQASDHMTDILDRADEMQITSVRLVTEPSDNVSVNDLLHWGTELFRRGDYVGARRVFRQAHDLDEESYLALFGEGHAAFAVGDYRGASLALRSGLNLFPSWTEVEVDRPGFYEVASDYDAQLNLAELHVQRFHGDSAALFCLAYNLYYDGDIPNSAALMSQIPPGSAEYPAAELYLEAISRRWQ